MRNPVLAIAGLSGLVGECLSVVSAFDFSSHRCRLESSKGDWFSLFLDRNGIRIRRCRKPDWPESLGLEIKASKTDPRTSISMTVWTRSSLAWLLEDGDLFLSFPRATPFVMDLFPFFGDVISTSDAACFDDRPKEGFDCSSAIYLGVVLGTSLPGLISKDNTGSLKADQWRYLGMDLGCPYALSSKTYEAAYSLASGHPGLAWGEKGHHATLVAEAVTT